MNKTTINCDIGVACRDGTAIKKTVEQIGWLFFIAQSHGIYIIEQSTDLVNR